MRVAGPIAAPVTENVPTVLPCGIVTLGSVNVATLAGFAESATTVPPLGAGELSVTVPVTERPTPTLEALSDKRMLAGETVTEVSPDW